MTYAKDTKYHWKIKHSHIQYHYIRDMVIQKDVNLKHNSTNKMVADPTHQGNS